VAWNEPGNTGGKDPWGQRNKNQGPPDLDQVVKNIQDKLRGLFGGGGGGKRTVGSGNGNMGGYGVALAVAVALVLWLLSGFYVVQQGERGVILQFGNYDETKMTQAGLHWRWPYPMETVEKVNVEQVSTLEVGYRSKPGGSTVKVPTEALMLTEDENIIDIEFAVQYKVTNASAYLFNVRDPKATVLQATESAVREIVGKSTLDFVITEGRDAIAQDTRVLLQEILDRYKTGIHVVTVQMQKALPPAEVKAAFDDAVTAREDEQRLKNEAEAYSNDLIPRARGGAARLMQEAEGYKARVIARAEGDARRFSQVVREYAKAPRVTRERLYLEAMEQVLSNTTKVYVDQKGGNNMLYLPLDKLINPSSAAAATGPVNTLLQPLSEQGDIGQAGRDRTHDVPRNRGAQQ
jgi:modulator of FtsH protease HflK